MGRPSGVIYGCDGKQAFATYGEGEVAIRRIRKFSKKDGKLSLYRCSYCPAWHMGSKFKGTKSK